MVTEKRLIDANALCDLLDVEYKRKMELVRKGETHLDTLAEGIMSMSVLLGTMPTVDAVEVVRCKDCKWYKEGELLAPNKFCFRLVHPTEYRHIGYNYNADDFCSYGERRTNETDKP